MKLCLVSSPGGHFSEMMQLQEAFTTHTHFFVTYRISTEREFDITRRTYFSDNIGTSLIRMARAFGWALWILAREKPDVIVSTGAEIAIPFFFWSRPLKIRTVYIESWCRVDDLSRTGRLLYPLADIFLVQWAQLLPLCGKKARFWGAVA